jgi:hypothetical protein
LTIAKFVGAGAAQPLRNGCDRRKSLISDSFVELFPATIGASFVSNRERRQDSMKKALTILMAIGISVAYAASSYHVTLSKPTAVNGTELKPGEYKLELQGDKAILKQGKTTVETNVTVENAPQKFNLTAVGYSEDGKLLKEIRVGGTTVKVLFESSKTEAAVGSK